MPHSGPKVKTQQEHLQDVASREKVADATSPCNLAVYRILALICLIS